MSENKIIPTVQIASGDKFFNGKGIRAIKDGIKASNRDVERLPKPKWLRVKIRGGPVYENVKNIVTEHKLATVCEEAKCPNMGECWSAGTATIMLMGDVCTRACPFCSVNTGNPMDWLDPDEPEHTARSVELMGLKYIVLTSVNRDDLDDGGAGHYAACVRRVKAVNPNVAVEVFAQNVETVKRLTHPVRDPRASYEQTLTVLAHAKAYRPDVLTKTSVMLGLGETHAEIIEIMDDLRAAKVDILTFGQYLQPTAHHLPIARYITPEEFEMYRQRGLEKGFLEVVSGVLVRSSYRAEQVLEKNNVGLASS